VRSIGQLPAAHVSHSPIVRRWRQAALKHDYLDAWATPVVVRSPNRGNAIHPGNRPVGWQTPLNRARIVNTEGSISADTGGEYQR